MVFTDTHTHIYSREFDDDRKSMMNRAREMHVDYLFLPSIDQEYHRQMLTVAREHPGCCFPMMGLHPTSVRDNYIDELKTVSDYLNNPALKFCAIGEIGIDLYWDKSREGLQREAFNIQLDLALRHNLPVAIHTRNSIDITLDLVEARKNSALRGVFHCFSGNTDHAQRAIRMGFKLGIGGVVTYKNSGLQTVVLQTDLEHLLLETDAPWLPPVPHRGERNEPSYIPLIAQKISEIKALPLFEVAEKTTVNALTLFGIA